MPSLIVNTNQTFANAEARNAFLREASQSIGAVLGKSEQWIVVAVNHSEGLIFSGSFDPAAYCELSSIGGISATSNEAVTRAISDLLHKHLNIASDRVYVVFHDIKVMLLIEFEQFES